MQYNVNSIRVTGR